MSANYYRRRRDGGELSTTVTLDRKAVEMSMPPFGQFDSRDVRWVLRVIRLTWSYGRRTVRSFLLSYHLAVDLLLNARR